MAASANASTRSNERWLGLETTCVKAHRASPSFRTCVGSVHERGDVGSAPSRLLIVAAQRAPQVGLDANLGVYTQRHNLFPVQDDNFVLWRLSFQLKESFSSVFLRRRPVSRPKA